MPPSNERLRAALVITAAVILAALFAWSFVRDVGAQGICAWLCGEFCDSLDDTYPDDAPWHVERSRDEGGQCWCECCDASRGISYQRRIPNATAIPATATPRPTSTRVNTPTPTLEPTWTTTPTAPAPSASATQAPPIRECHDILRAFRRAARIDDTSDAELDAYFEAAEHVHADGMADCDQRAADCSIDGDSQAHND